MREKTAYTRIYNWFKKNRSRISDIYPRKDRYFEYSKKFIAAMPAPEEATREDMLVTAQQVLMGLLEWAYHQKDKYGIPMHDYARIIWTNISREDVSLRRSRLNKIVLLYRRGLRK